MDNKLLTLPPFISMDFSQSVTRSHFYCHTEPGQQINVGHIGAYFGPGSGTSMGQTTSGTEKTEFEDHAARWERESSIHSAPAAKYLHKDYQWVISRGMSAVPFILERIQTSKKDWFWALQQITQENPACEAESFADAARLWVKWGRDNSFLI